MNFKSSERSAEWATRFPKLVSALNNEETRLIGKKPIDAIKGKVVDAKISTTYSRPVSLKKEQLDSSKNLRCLFAALVSEGLQYLEINSE